MNDTNTIHKVQYEWRIDHYTFYDAKGKNFDSPVFCAETENAYKWHLKIKLDRENFLGLILLVDNIGTNGTIFGKFKFAILDEKQEMIQSRQCSQNRRFKLGKERGWGFKNFITKNMLLNSGLLINDTLKVYCSVIFSEKNDFTGDFYQPMIQPPAICNEHTLSVNFESLLTNQIHFDAVLITKDDKKFYAHKIILAARSPVFNRMFQHTYIYYKVYVCEIGNLNGKIVEEMLHYIYSDKCDNLKELAEDLLVAAVQYDLKGLRFKCEKVLSENLSIKNATRILILAEMYGANDLKLNAVRFIVVNSNKIVNTATWDNMVVSHPQLFNEVFKALCQKVTMSRVI